MDFKSLINKIDSIEELQAAPKTIEQTKRVQLDEDAELRVLAGTSSLLAEVAVMEKKHTKAEKEKETASNKKSESISTEKETISELDMNLLKAAQKGQEGKPIGKPDAESDKNVKKKYGYRMDGEPAERDDDPSKQERRGRKRKNEDIEIDTESFKSKFLQMVEEKKKEAKKTVKGKKAEEKMDEAKGSKPDFLDVDKDGDTKEPMKKAAKEAGKNGDKEESKGLSAKQKKLPPGLQKAIAAKKGKKKTVKESYEPKMSFREMMRLVVESGGQQQIDPLDKALFAWATRVAQNKLGENTKSEVYAGLVYERMGGRFEMYDVLSEDQK